MKKDDLVERRHYALRNRSTDHPFTKVAYVGPTRSRQSRIRYLDGELEGLEEWVPSRIIACAWGDRKSLLRDEERAAELRKADGEVWDAVTEEAISTVMTASGEYTGYLREWDTDPASAQRYWNRAGLSGSPLEDHPRNYQDRHGTWHLTFATALRAAEAFAATEPELVDLHIRGWEDELKAEGFMPGQRHSHDTLRQWSPHFALARSWTQRPRGHAAEQEVERLQRLLRQAIQDLRDSGSDDQASRIERGMQGR